MAFAIVTDSSSNLTEEVIDQFDLHILPLNVHGGRRGASQLPQGAQDRP